MSFGPFLVHYLPYSFKVNIFQDQELPLIKVTFKSKQKKNEFPVT